MNTEKYIQTMTWLQTLTGLLEHMQVCSVCVCVIGSVEPKGSSQVSKCWTLMLLSVSLKCLTVDECNYLCG